MDKPVARDNGKTEAEVVVDHGTKALNPPEAVDWMLDQPKTPDAMEKRYAQTDMYSFGVMAAVMLGGAPPFPLTAAVPQIRGRKIDFDADPKTPHTVTAESVFQKALERGVDPDIVNLAKRTLSTDPNKRPTADQMVAMFHSKNKSTV